MLERQCSYLGGREEGKGGRRGPESESEDELFVPRRYVRIYVYIQEGVVCVFVYIHISAHTLCVYIYIHTCTHACRKTQQEAAEEEKEYAEFAKDRLAGD